MQDPQIDDVAALARLNSLAQKAAEAGRIENSPDEAVRWKTFRLKIESVEEDGTFTGYASVWGTIDSDDEIVDKGATTRSIKNNPNFTLLWQHNTFTPVGFNVSAAEDDHGLFIKGELMLDCEQGRYAYAFLKKAQKLKGRAGLSIGFRILQDAWVKHKDGKTRRHFTEIAILETSIVTFAANPDAFVTSVKAAFLNARGGERDEMEEPIVEAAMRAEDGDGKAAAENLTTKDGQMAKSHTDFATALAAQQKERDMYDQRNDISSALYKSLESIHQAEELDVPAKKAAIYKVYADHGSAMGDWHCKAYFDGEKASGLQLEKKSASEAEFHMKGKMPKAGRAKMAHAMDLHHSAIDLHNKAMTICKSMMDGSDDDAGANDEMGAMGDPEAIEATKTEAEPEIIIKSQSAEDVQAFFESLRTSFKLSDAA